MITKALIIAPVMAFAMSMGNPAVAATPAETGAAAHGQPDAPHHDGTAQPGQPGQPGQVPPLGMTDAMPGGMMGGGMMGKGMMSGGMMPGGMMGGGMMGACPMMDAINGPNGKVMMQMHGEMMRAMGDIMMKYADKIETPAPPR